MPVNASTLPEPKWAEKPVIVIVGDAPDTEEYRTLHSFLRERIHADEIEVVWVNHLKIENSPRVFDGDKAIRDFGSQPIMDFFVPTLDFSFPDTQNPGNDRLRDDARLEKFSSTRINNPLTVVITLHEGMSIQFSELWMDDPDSLNQSRPLESWLELPTAHYFLGSPAEHLAAVHLASPDACAYITHQPTQLSDDVRNALIKSSHLLRFAINKMYPRPSVDFDRRVNMTRQFARLTNGQKGKRILSTSISDPFILDEVIKHLTTKPVSFFFNRKAVASDKKKRVGTKLATPSIAIAFLEAHLMNARDKRLEQSRSGIDPEQLPPKLRQELALLESEVERTQTRLKELRRELADEMANAAEMRNHIKTEVADLEASLAAKRSQFESELDALRSETEAEIAERHASLDQDREELERHQVEFHDEKARFGERITDISVKRTLAIGYVARDLHRFQYPSNTVTKRMILGFIPWTTTEIEDSESALQHSINVVTEYRDAIQTVAMMIREHPEKPVNLYDATFYFIAQRAIAVAQLDVAPILRTDAIATARMLKISYDAAPQNEREWFASLDRDKVIPEDTAHEMMVYLVEAAITNRFDGQLTMAELAAVLEKITVDDDVLVLPEGTHNDIDVLSSTLPAVNAPAHVIEAAGVETPTPDSLAPPLR